MKIREMSTKERAPPVSISPSPWAVAAWVSDALAAIFFALALAQLLLLHIGPQARGGGETGWGWALLLIVAALMRGGAGNDRVDGGNDDDLLLGDDGADTLYGRNGNDVLLGGNGLDTLYGHNGDDLLYASGLVDGVELDELIEIWMLWQSGTDNELAADLLTDIAVDDLVSDSLHGDRGVDWYLLFAEFAEKGKDQLRVRSDGNAPNEVIELM